MRNSREWCLLILLFALLSGCSEVPSQMQSASKMKILLVQESLYEVKQVDGLYGSWARACDEEDCLDINLTETDFRGNVKKGSVVKVTETIVEKGNKSWSEREYKFFEE